MKLYIQNATDWSTVPQSVLTISSSASLNWTKWTLDGKPIMKRFPLRLHIGVHSDGFLRLLHA